MATRRRISDNQAKLLQMIGDSDQTSRRQIVKMVADGQLHTGYTKVWDFVGS